MLYLVNLLAVVLVVKSAELQFVNKENSDIWVGIIGNYGKLNLENGGFILHAGFTTSIEAPEKWAGRLWGRTYCDINTQQCLTGDCGNGLHCDGQGHRPPASIIEISLNVFNGLDFYDVNLIDGFNLPITIEPVNGTGTNNDTCAKIGCPLSLNSYCPENMKLNSNFGVVGCRSACAVYNTDQLCRANRHSSPHRWLVKYGSFFKFNCPLAYSFAYDDRLSTVHTCTAQKYVITFGL